MEENMEARLRIINQFNSGFGGRRKSVANRITWLKFYIGFCSIFLAFSLTAVLFSVLDSFFDISLLQLNWDKSSKMILFNITFVLHFPKFLFEIRLLRHQQRLVQQNIWKPSLENNAELFDIIKRINNPARVKYIIGLTLIILLLVLWQMITEPSPFGKMAMILTLLLVTIIGFQYRKLSKRLSANLSEAERGMGHGAVNSQV